MPETIEVAEAVERIKAYREQIEGADKQADRNSLDRAADLELIYQSMTWVEDLPAPKHKVWRGRPVDPKSRNRFAGWVLQQTGLSPSRVTRLHSAHEVAAIISAPGTVIRPQSERSLRSFARLRRAGYGDRIPDVYQEAVKLAAGAAPGSTETRRAVSEFLSQWSPQQRRERSAQERARSHRYKAQTAVEILLSDDVCDEVAAFRQWVIDRLTQ
jgi:hypothetical protein